MAYAPTCVFVFLLSQNGLESEHSETTFQTITP